MEYLARLSMRPTISNSEQSGDVNSSIVLREDATNGLVRSAVL
jgi:hypothetical protein